MRWQDICAFEDELIHAWGNGAGPFCIGDVHTRARCAAPFSRLPGIPSYIEGQIGRLRMVDEREQLSKA